MASKKDQSIDLDTVMKNPASFGLPTFEEFSKNPARWRLAKDLWFEQISDGSDLFKNIKRHAYIVITKEGRKIDCGRSLERVDEALKNQGVPRHLARIRPNLVQDGIHIIHEVFFEDPRYVETPQTKP